MDNLTFLQSTWEFSSSGNRLALDGENNIVVVSQSGSYTIPGSNLLGVTAKHPDLHYYTIRSPVAVTERFQGLRFVDNSPLVAENDRVYALGSSNKSVDDAFYATRLFPAPTSNTIQNDAPVQTGSLTNVLGMDADAWFMFNGGLEFFSSGPVTHLVDENQRMIVNVTFGGGHALHPGIIVRHVFEDTNGVIYTETLGIGVGDFGAANSVLAQVVWPDVPDVSIRDWLSDGGQSETTRSPSSFAAEDVIEFAMGWDALSESEQELAILRHFIENDLEFHPVNTPEILYDLFEIDIADRIARTLEDGCFLAGTEISLLGSISKPIEEIEVGDQVTSYDQHGNLVPGKVTRVFRNRVKHVLDVFGLHVTPGHVTLCGDGPFAGRHVPMIDILRSDGALVRESGEKIRACTNEPVGSAKDRLIWAVTGEKQADGSLKVRDRGRIRLGTRFITAEGYDVSAADLIAAAHATVTPEGLIQQSSGGAGVPFFWSFTARLPRPEDYVLQRSELQLNDIYQAAEWESVPPHLPRPSVAMA